MCKCMPLVRLSADKHDLLVLDNPTTGDGSYDQPPGQSRVQLAHGQGGAMAAARNVHRRMGGFADRHVICGLSVAMAVSGHWRF